jgi:hypothetical protein
VDVLQFAYSCKNLQISMDQNGHYPVDCRRGQRARCQKPPYSFGCYPSSIPVPVPKVAPEQPVGDVLPDSTPEPVEAPGAEPNEDPAPEVEDAGDEPPELVAAGGDDSDDEAEESDDEDESSDDEDDEEDEDEDGGVRRSARIAAGVQPPARYTMVSSPSRPQVGT